MKIVFELDVILEDYYDIILREATNVLEYSSKRIKEKVISKMKEEYSLDENQYTYEIVGMSNYIDKSNKMHLLAQIELTK